MAQRVAFFVLALQRPIGALSRSSGKGPPPVAWLLGAALLAARQGPDVTVLRDVWTCSMCEHTGLQIRDLPHSTGVPLLGVPLAMRKISPIWLAEATDRLLAADGLIARDSDEDEEEEDDEEEEEDTEDEYDGYSE